MRTIWNGSISFGLVNIPVGLALATTPKAKQSDVSFRTLHRECKTPIRQKRWCPTHDREVGPDEIVKGWEVTKGEFVIVEDADLEAIQLAEYGLQTHRPRGAQRAQHSDHDRRRCERHEQRVCNARSAPIDSPTRRFDDADQD